MKIEIICHQALCLPYVKMKGGQLMAKTIRLTVAQALVKIFK